MTSHGDGTFSGYDGLKLYRQYWKVDSPKAVVIIVHGLAEHSGRYQHVAAFFNDMGFNVHAYDHRGHGKSEGDRGYVKDFDEYLKDLDIFIKLVKKEENTLPLYVLGHSMGGLIVLRYGILYPNAPVKGMIVSAPALRTASKPGKFTMAMGKFLSKLSPKSKIDPKIDPAWLSHDKEVVSRYANDPLVFKKITARLGIEMLKKGEDTLKRASEFKYPLLLIVGTEDKLVDPEAVKEFYEKTGSSDRELMVYDGFYHELLNETEKEKVMADIKEWLEKRMSE